VSDLTVTRMDDEVYARFTVPRQNVDNVGPADIARVELYAITADRALQGQDPDDVRERATLVASELVRPPLPPPPESKEGARIPALPPAPGVDQGAVVVMREPLTAETRVPVDVPDVEDRRPAVPTAGDVPRPLVLPAESAGLQRYYFVIGVTRRGREGPASGFVPAPLGPTSSAPGRPEITVDEQSMTIRWAPAADARGSTEATTADVLPSRPVVPGPPATTYDVYEVSKDPVALNASPSLPTPLTPAPVGALEFSQTGITLGKQRCFVVRPVDIVSGIHVRGPSSSVACASFADTFLPGAPGKLGAVATSGMISLIWEPSAAKDLAGYLVLRGDSPDATLTPLMSEPIRETTYRDGSVRPDVRYVYAVVAVDTAGNRSTESNRIEETARP